MSLEERAEEMWIRAFLAVLRFTVWILNKIEEEKCDKEEI